MLALFGGDWASRAAALELAGVIRPGVDGRIAGVWSRTAEFEMALLAALEREAVRAGFAWSIVSEAEFGRR